MSSMMSVSSGFQYSVNIAYDLNNDDKLKNFIPTKSSLELLEDVILSTHVSSNNRARILIGAYGKGKSHIVLMILAILMKKDINLFEKSFPKIKENKSLYQLVLNYYESNEKLLPVVISGSNTSLSQAFLMALQRTLHENNLMDVMPETNYKAAISVINRWKNDYPQTYYDLEKIIDEPITRFIEKLEDYNSVAYDTFEKVYPKLTAGSVFNPFLGFDVVELYENAVKGLKNKGYTGIYIVYDEFSKYLEANITEASVSDTKMLQDFAEKCNRSGKNQLHLMLISHKEVSNYIEALPKHKVDGWRGVSERFTHIHLNNNFTQTYEIIASVIHKDKEIWNCFKKKFEKELLSLYQRYSQHVIFSDLNKNEIVNIIEHCYPLHPISTFILPRLSERIAQNERTLFTFLSAQGKHTLSSFLGEFDDDEFKVITPDLIYDYFEPLLRKEVYTSESYKIYQLTRNILDKIEFNSLQSKIVKTLSLMYILEQFELLKPTKDEIVGIYSISYTVAEIESAIKDLIEKEFVIYLKRSNDYLKLKQSSGVDIPKQINEMVALMNGKISTKDTLNSLNFDNYMYPSRYNDEKEMTRYFNFEFIDGSEVDDTVKWNIKSETLDGDGVIYAIIPNSEEQIDEIYTNLLKTSKDVKNCIFILPKKYKQIESIIAEYVAVKNLRSKAIDDKVLFEEYDVIYEDLTEMISAYISSYTRPEEFKSSYIYLGNKRKITRKASLTELLSTICDDLFFNTPVINNEAINKNEITSIASNSRNKIIAGLLRNELEVNLGLTGSGQEVSIMRSTLIRTGILVEENGECRIELNPKNELLKNMLDCIISFIVDVKEEGKRSFSDLYNALIDSKNHIGLRKGVIPIYLAAVFHEYKQNLVIYDRFNQVNINVDTLLQINSNPDLYSLSFLDWNPDRESFVVHLAQTFSDFVNIAEKSVNSYDYIILAMRRWYLSLPKYAKETKKCPNGESIDKRYLQYLRLLKQNSNGYELLFNKLPEVFGYKDEFNVGLWENIAASKRFYDDRLHDLRSYLIKEVKIIFSKNNNADDRSSLTSIIRDWCEDLDPKVFEELFPDGTEKCLALLKTITHDEEMFISRLAKAITELRLEDWDDLKIKEFLNKLIEHKKVAENFVSSDQTEEKKEIDSYQVSFLDAQGNSVTKRFNRVEESKRGKLLYNAITANIESMGHSISEQEKRQILMEILKELC